MKSKWKAHEGRWSCEEEKLMPEAREGKGMTCPATASGVGYLKACQSGTELAQ